MQLININLNEYPLKIMESKNTIKYTIWSNRNLGICNKLGFSKEMVQEVMFKGYKCGCLVVLICILGR